MKNYQLIAEKVSELNIDNQYLEELVESVGIESLKRYESRSR